MAVEENEFVAFLLDQLQLIGPVSARRMFGGHGIFLEGLMFALVSDETLYFKVDEANRSDYLQLGLQPFTFMRQSKAVALSYYQAPEELLDDSQALVNWGNQAFAAALRQRR